jgi:hypothetical protein
MRPLLALLCLAAISCAAQPLGPFFGDEKYLRFGVDPDEETTSVVEGQGRRGYVVGLKLVGQTFTALGFMTSNGRNVAVRVITSRGIAIALDPEDASLIEQEVTYALLNAPIHDTHDADHDGFEEVFIEQRTAADNCILVYRVRDVGFVDPVHIDTRAIGQDFCPNAVVDLEDDGSAELLADLALHGFGPVTPRVRVALWPRNHEFELRGNPNGLARFTATERAGRERALADARARRDIPEALRLGIELAALAHLSGADPNKQVAELDAALRGLVLSRAEATTVLTARSRIFQAWNTAPPSPSGTSADKEAARP